MEGSFLPGSKRQQLAQQGRKSHFVLGKTSHGYSTTQTSFYRPATTSASPARSANQRTASHFSLGSDRQAKKSEFGVNFKQHPVGPRKAKGKIIDLTPTTFVLGMQDMKFLTTQSFYKDPGQSKRESYSNSPAKNRKHNFGFGNDSPVKASVMHSDYSKQGCKVIEKVDKNLLDSHIIMGFHPHAFKTVFSQHYSHQHGSPGKLPPGKHEDLQKEHFCLGNSKGFDQTTHESTFKNVKTEHPGQAHVNYLKASHFSFQSENPDYVTTAQKTMCYSPAEKRTQDKYLKENHVLLGSDKVQKQSNYSKNHEFRSQSVTQPTRTKIEELQSDVILGVTNSNMGSTMNAALNISPGKPGRLEKSYEKLLRTHHYTLGNSTNIYERNHKNYGSEQGSPSKFLDGLKEDMLNTHWVSGFHKEKLNTSMKSEFKPAQGEKRTPEDYLKKHNHKIGDSSNNWGTSYNGGFKWIQPVPDSSVKFSFE